MDTVQITEFDKVVDEVDNLLTINSEQLEFESIRNVKIFISLNKIYFKHFSELNELYELQSQLKLSRWKYYSGKATSEEYKKEPLRETILKQDIDKYLNNDEKMKIMNKEVVLKEKIVQFLEESKRTLNYRGMDIKTALEVMKFKSGN